MDLNLRDETVDRLKKRLEGSAYSTMDDLLIAALDALNDFDDQELDEETLAAIDEAEAQIARGEYRDWKEVKAELKAKYLGQ